ncbi:LLM class flavin-dependent oxidoreductase [Algibacter amylolyticus]|uniref:Luciferase-like monooxygenase n=1 Tax=Algibacter amylolyticus TaxID=1608400 RepID=A0A5M7BE76_9FLAO|nr:LLM class flavin-dependent oxidoreductase [Algibacter amylolyticus]KAA5825701.1 LLM class flavin-dependent oxidoreductase [Algibacter amylolyticus]MBB5268066.1 luciferase family oxidoreductase group 1 [Algibacter amylolyticus]TSJ79999.1 LLM class flavin-dependent oxidoreductase [Algibacter amylolyticus]
MKQTAYSILDLVIVSEGKTYQQTLKASIELAKKAESFGYKRVWYAEHHNMAGIASNAPQIIISQVAQKTKTLRVGSGGIMLPNHSPFIITEQFGTLGTLFPNRIDLGLGRAPGTDQETAHAIRPNFLKATHSFPQDIEQIQNYFSAENSISKVRVPIAEGVPVPIYILGSSTDSAHLAAKKGLPYAFASHFATAHLHNAITIYRNEFKPSESLETPYVIAGINVFIADTDEEAETMATSFFKMIIALLTSTKREHLEKPMEMTAELRETMKHPAVKQMTKYTFIGSKSTVKQDIQDFLNETQVDELIAVTNTYDANSRIKSYRYFAEIMKELNSES